MPLKTIRLVLARSKETPEGDRGHSYEFRAPLDGKGKLDQTAWPGSKELCLVKKFIHGAEVEKGLLVHSRNGKWVFSYEQGTDDDEAVFRLSSHTFVPGEYVSITEHDGVQRTFQIESVADWHPSQAEGVNVARWPRR